MPRYFFHLFEVSTKNLVRDLEGTSLSNTGEAKREAIGLARDIVEHGLHQSTWQVVVTDENAANVLMVSLSQIRQRKMRVWLDLVRRTAMYEPRFQPHLFAWLLTAMVCAVIIQAAELHYLSRRDRSQATGFPNASIPRGTIVGSESPHVGHHSSAGP
jgi:hypothetical protein